MKKILLVLIFCFLLVYASETSAATCRFDKDAYTAYYDGTTNASATISFLMNYDYPEEEVWNYRIDCNNDGSNDVIMNYQNPSKSPSFSDICNIYNSYSTYSGIIRVSYANESTPSIRKTIVCTNSAGGYLFNVNVLPTPKIVTGSISYSLTYNSITVSWQTDIPANASINYTATNPMTGSAVYIQGPGDSAMATSHSLTVPNLDSLTTYYFVITSCNEGGCDHAQGMNATLARPVDASPVPGLVHAVQISDFKSSPSGSSQQGSSVTFSAILTNNGNFEEDIQAGFMVDSTTGNANPYRIPMHLSIGEIKPLTYSWDTTGISLGAHTFTAFFVYSNSSVITAAAPAALTLNIVAAAAAAPAISGVNVDAAANTATITWATDVDSDGSVYYGEANPVMLAEDKATTKSHRVELKNLKNGTTYFYYLLSCAKGACGNYMRATPAQFTTKKDAYTYCASLNNCTGNVFQRYVERNGRCEPDSPVTCGNSGCGIGVCTASGCKFQPDNSQCTENCAIADKSMLGLVPYCSDENKCDFANPAPCDAQNKATRVILACSGKEYCCAEIDGKRQWTDNTDYCTKAVVDDKPKPTFISTPSAQPVKQKDEVVNDRELIVGSGVERPNEITFPLFQVDPPGNIRGDEKVTVLVSVASSSAITSAKCDGPDGSGICTCIIDSAKSEVWCDIEAPALGELQSGTFLVLVGNKDRGGGTFSIELEKGKKASISRVTIEDAQNRDIFLVSSFAAGVLILISLFSIINKYRMRKVRGKELRRILEMIPQEMQQLQYKRMKGSVDEQTYVAMSMAIDKKRAETEAALREWNKKYGKKSGGEEEEIEIPTDKSDEDALAKLKLKKEGEKPKEGEKATEGKKDTDEMDMLYKELQKKVGGKGEK